MKNNNIKNKKSFWKRFWDFICGSVTLDADEEQAWLNSKYINPDNDGQK